MASWIKTKFIGDKTVTAAKIADSVLVTSVKLTLGAEVANVIPVTVEGLPGQYKATVRSSTMSTSTPATFHLAETGVGAEVSATGQSVLLFTTDAAGVAEISVTDAVGGGPINAYLEITPASEAASQTLSSSSILAITFA
jgi:hypothetical protein